MPDRDPVGAEDLREQRGAAVAAHEHRDLLRRHAVAHQLEHLGADDLRLGALAARLQQPHRAVGRALLAAGLEQAALEVVQGGPGEAGVVVGALGQLDHLGARGELLHRGRAAGERVAPRLVGQRDADLGLGEPRERVHGVELRRVRSSKP